MIRAVTYYQPVCDKCGTTEHDAEYSAWSDQGSAHSAAISNDWCDVDGKLLCPKCQACHVCSDPPTVFGIGPSDDNVPLCEEHEHHYEAEEPHRMKRPSARIAAAAEKIAEHQRSLTPEQRAAEEAEFEQEKAAMLAAAAVFDPANSVPGLTEEPTDGD